MNIYFMLKGLSGDFSYPPTDKECQSWMQFLRDLHDKREAERKKEREEIYKSKNELLNTWPQGKT